MKYIFIIIVPLIVIYLALRMKEEKNRNKYLPIVDKIKSEQQKKYIIQQLRLGEEIARRQFMYEWTADLMKLKEKVITESESLSIQDINSINNNIGQIFVCLRR